MLFRSVQRMAASFSSSSGGCGAVPMQKITETVTLHFLRHGEATHNVNAEPMRKNGCSYDEFIAQMALDDEVDARLTQRGERQALEVRATATAAANVLDAIVSSPLSRALKTADLVFPSSVHADRICLETMREHNGMLLNGKRREKRILEKEFPDWNFEDIAPGEDTLWTADELEHVDSVAARGYGVLRWIWGHRQVYSSIAIAGHGSLFHQLLNNHSRIIADEGMRKRFANCELRSCVMSATEGTEGVVFNLRCM